MNWLTQRHKKIGIGGALRPRPSHTTVRTSSYTAVRRIVRLAGREERQAECGEGGVGECKGQRGAVAEPPRAMWAAGGCRRQIPADAAASQFGKARAPALPLLPDECPQASSHPLVEFAQHRRSLAEAEVAAPSKEIARQLSNDLREAHASCTTRHFQHSRFEPHHRLGRQAALDQRVRAISTSGVSQKPK